MAEGPHDAHVCIEKSLQYMNDLNIQDTTKVITVAVIKWPYGISLLVCGLLFQRLYLGGPIFKTQPLLK